ncbi:hypothetical protein [Amorphus sp. 3PC139-8]|uniref:hypothetical protein n=1 Tax=Amorphus sp. 3PC139-8 TaxID=2735676 RepID=UPI00345C9B91
MSGDRPTRARVRLAARAGQVAALAGVRLSAWGEGFQVAGRTGRRELALDLAEAWRAADRLGTAIDPLDEALLTRLAGETGKARP